MLHNYGKYHKTHNMTMRYRHHTVICNDIEDIPTPHNDTAPLENTPPTHSILEQDGETTAEYSEDPNPQRDLAELQKHFWQLQEWLTQVEPTTIPPAHIEVLADLTSKLQLLAITLQPCPFFRASENPCTQQCRNTLTPCAPQSLKWTSPHLYFKTSPHFMDRAPWS